MHLFGKRSKPQADTEPKPVRRLRISSHPAVTIPLLTCFFLTSLTIVGVVAFSGGGSKLRSTDTHIVIISHDKKEQVVPTRAKTVKEVLEKNNVTVRSGDVVEPAVNSEISADNFRINVYRAVPVTIVDGAHKTFTYSAATTPRSIVKQAGIQVYPEDNLELLPTDNFLTEGSIGQRVVIQRATAVNVNVYGTPVQMRTRSATVGALMAERGLKLEPSDTLQPNANTPITPNMQIFILRKGTKIITEEQAIPMPVETVEDNSLTFGTTATRQQGADGKKIITYQIETQNDKEVSRKVIQEVVAQEPVKQVVAKGTFFDIAGDKSGVLAAAGIPSGSYMYADYVIEHESHWNPAALNAAGCAGLGQACPGSKLAAACPNWKLDPVCQMQYFNGYAVGRYGGWSGAYAHKVSTGWW